MMAVDVARIHDADEQTREVGGVLQAAYSIDPEAQLVRLTVHGEITAAGLIDVMTRVGADPRFVNGMSAIADLREASGEWDYSEIQRLRDFLVSLDMPREVRWAAVVRAGRLVSVGRVLIVISEALNARIRIKMFDAPASALRWVQEDAP